jgi:hypothetical protein
VANVPERFFGIAPLRFSLPIDAPFQIASEPGSACTFINERDFMGKNWHRCGVNNLHDGINICFSIPRPACVNGDLQNFSSLCKFAPRDLPEISSPNYFYLILPKNVTNFFSRRLIIWRLCGRM